MAIIHHGDLFAHGFGDFSGVDKAAQGHGQRYRQHTVMNIKGVNHQDQADDFWCVVETAGETDGYGAQVMQCIDKFLCRDAKQRAAVFFNAVINSTG